MLSSLKDSYDHYIELQEKIARDSVYQLVTREYIVCVDLISKEMKLGVEVVGPKQEILQDQTWSSVDILKYDFQQSASELQEAFVLEKCVEISSKMSGKLSTFVYIVQNEDKLSLHFFNQNDYSQLHC